MNYCLGFLLFLLVEAYITPDNLNADNILANCVQENDGWIRLELLSRCNKLSSYNYDKILKALSSIKSNQIELSSFEPRCIRLRCQLSTGENIQGSRTVVVTGLPYGVQHDDLVEVFNRFYPIQEIRMLSLFNRFSGEIHIIFHKRQDALDFVQQSKQNPAMHTNNNLHQLCHEYGLDCKMLQGNYDRDHPRQKDQRNFLKGKKI